MLVAGILWFAIDQPIQVLPRITLAPGYALTDQLGETHTSEDQRGKFTLYTFGYSHCSTPCVQTSESLAAVQKMLPEVDTNGIAVELVTISFDPTRDTPQQLQAFAASLGADAERWHLITGDEEKLKTVIGGGFGAYFHDNGDGSFAFDPLFVMVDGNGIIRSRYRTPALNVEIIARDLRLMATEVKNSKGAAKLAYEAAHLFLCYPK